MRDVAIELVRTRLDVVERRARLVLVVAQRAELELKDTARWAGRSVPGWAAWSDVAIMCEEAIADVERKRRLVARLEAGEDLGPAQILDWLLEA